MSTPGYTDASAVAVGSVVMPYAGDDFIEPSYWYDGATPHAGQIFADFGHEIDMALFTDKQKKESSTLRELLGLVRVCLVHLKNWSNHCVRVFVDNAALAKIMIRGSRIPYLHTRVRKLVATFATHNIRIKVIWIPRKKNQGADTASKKIELERLNIEDYTLVAKTFKHLTALYGTFEVDMFASAINTKCVHFIGRHADIRSIPSTIDAFFQPYWGRAFYAFPPVDDTHPTCTVPHTVSTFSQGTSDPFLMSGSA